MRWASEIHVPLLLLHGSADWRVSPLQSLRMAEELQRVHQPYTLHIFEGGSHVELSGDQPALDAEITGYFREHVTR